MKSYLLVCLVAAAIMATQGYRHSHIQESHQFQDEALSALDNMEDPASGAPPQPPQPPQPPPNPHECNCDGVCRDLHEDRLPKEIQVSTTQAEITTLKTKQFEVRGSKLENDINLLSAFIKFSIQKAIFEDITLKLIFLCLFFLGQAQLSELREFPSIVS